MPDNQVVLKALLGIQTIVADHSDADRNMRTIVDGICNGIRDGSVDFDVDQIAVLQHIGIKCALTVDDRHDYVGYIADLVNEVY